MKVTLLRSSRDVAAGNQVNMDGSEVAIGGLLCMDASSSGLQLEESEHSESLRFRPWYTAGDGMRPSLRLIKLRGYSVLEQLRLEERLFYKNQENWCIFNDGTPDPTIVMGATGVAKELLDLEAVVNDRIPVVRRRSGGGTVVVDENTIFVSLIISKQPFVRINPDGVNAWCNDLYKSVFHNIPGFHLQATDHAIGERKFGGSAQKLQLHKRSLVHTSFLWDYEAARMKYLTIPRRAPAYRLGRGHQDFLCKLKDFVSHREQFYGLLQTGLEHYFSLEQPTADFPADDAIDTYPRATFVPLEELQTVEEPRKHSLRV